MIGAELEQLVRRIIREEVRAAIAEGGQTPSRHITIAEYAAARSISPSTVRAAIREHRLDSIKIGRAVRVPADAEIAASQPTNTTNRAALKLGLGLVRGGR